MSERNLTKQVYEMLDKSDAVRIEYIQKEKWLGYPDAKKILKKLLRMIKAPKRARTKGMIIVGDSNSGKTTIMNRFMKIFPVQENEDGECTIFTVLNVEAPEKPNPKALCMQILDKLGVPYYKRDALPVMTGQVVESMKGVGVKMLFIDEVHNLLAGHEQLIVQTMNVLKHFSNEVQIPIILLGVQSANQVISKTPEMASRIKPVQLRKWSNEGEADAKYRELLCSFESTLPLKHPSNLSKSDRLAKKIHKMTDGLIGEIADLLEEAAIEAIETGEEKITIKLLNSLGWLSPDQREHYKST